MRRLNHLFENNKAWAARISQQSPDFFLQLAKQQAPEYLWIGCSDSRVPANEIVGLMPGELFVHRNVANLVVHSDLNCLAVIQFAVEVLKVRHIIVTGHYGCGGVRAVLREEKLGLSDNWLKHVDDVRQKHRQHLDAAGSEARAFDLLCELNVVEQVVNVCQTSIVRAAWDRGQELAVHAWAYGIKDGHLRDLDCTVTGFEELEAVYSAAISRLG